MAETIMSNGPVWRSSGLAWASAMSAALVAVALFYDAVALMVHQWSTSEEYSHGFLIPLVALYLAWQKRERVETMVFTRSWAGVVLVVGGVLLYVMGDMSTLYIVIQYGFLLVIAGLVLSYIGWQAFREIWVSIALLAFTIPLPNFLYQGLSSQLQLISSEIGVWVIRLFGVSVFLEGNVIDLGEMKLQVVEACSGLRYLFPLVTVGFIAAALYRAVLWKRAIVFLSSIPITVFMNSFRIGVIGVMVEYWGKSMAEGFLHDFEGWVVFMASIGVLVLEMWALTKIGKEGRTFRDVFGMEVPERRPVDVPRQYRSLQPPFVVALATLVAATLLAVALPARTEVFPPRKEFVDFQLDIDEWKGRREAMDAIYLDALKLDDYIIADFVGGNDGEINFYAAYYASQRKGESTHSPRSCMPGDGWKIADLREQGVRGATIAGRPLVVNRAVIRKGEHQQLVYYWFQQRGRNITNEYLVKWYLFYDALTKNRTDGALVRLTTPIRLGESPEKGDERLAKFVASMAPRLEEYIPR